jgi:hypothetical protein
VAAQEDEGQRPDEGTWWAEGPGAGGREHDSAAHQGERLIAARDAEAHGANARGGGHDEKCDDWFTHEASEGWPVLICAV